MVRDGTGWYGKLLRAIMTSRSPMSKVFKESTMDAVSLSCTGREDVFYLELQNRWQKNTTSGVTCGAAIVNPPAGWHDFIKAGGGRL